MPTTDLKALAAKVREKMAAADAASGEPGSDYWNEHRNIRIADVLGELNKEEGAEFRKLGKNYMMIMAGIAATSANGWPGTLDVWCALAEARG